MRIPLVFALLGALVSPAMADDDTWFSEKQEARLKSATSHLERDAGPRSQAALKPCARELQNEAEHKVAASPHCRNAAAEAAAIDKAFHACARVTYSLTEFLHATGVPNDKVLEYTANVHRGAQPCIEAAIEHGWQDPSWIAKQE